MNLRSKSPVASIASDIVDALPRPHRPTPMSQLSWPRKVRRVGGLLMFVSSLAMGVSAATASSDWNVRSEEADPR